ncbi:class 3 lipase protein [Aphelenchoides avenae]|nr:class 3 lipase protein [Aphelenchus avenae]
MMRRNIGLLFLVFYLNESLCGKFPYDEDFARNKMMPLSAAAYNVDPADCFRHRLPNVKLHRSYSVHCDTSSVTWRNDTCFAYSAVSQADKAIIFAFRGSKSDMQIVHEVEAVVLYGQVRFYNMGSVSKYFFDAFNNLWQAGMHSDLLQLRKQYPDYQIWVTGHSLGAALASLAAAAISNTVGVSNDLRFVSFGQPRVGNIYYALAHDYAVPYSFRLVHAKDIVPAIPPSIKSWYWHHTTEVWYPGDMGPGAFHKVCEGQEDLNCSDGDLDLSTHDHSFYFDTDVEGYGLHGCH